MSVKKLTSNKNKATNFGRFSTEVTKITGRPVSFFTALIIVAVWAITGPIFHFSDTWQLVINTGTTIITCLMVFVIQQSQNKDTIAIHLKLNEIIAATQGASNRLIDIEDLTEEALEALKKFYIKLSDLAELEQDIQATHSIEDAEGLHIRKRPRKKKVDGTPDPNAAQVQQPPKDGPQSPLPPLSPQSPLASPPPTPPTQG